MQQDAQSDTTNSSGLCDRELEIRDVDKGTNRPPLKLRVRVADQVTESVPITFAIVGRGFRFGAASRCWSAC
jgi:hypothetical protein